MCMRTSRWTTVWFVVFAAATVLTSGTETEGQSPRANTTRAGANNARLQEAFAALYSGNPDRTLQLTSEYLKQHPADVEARVLLARAHVARDEYQAAYDILRAALTVDTRNADVLYFLGVVSGELATREFDRLYALAPEGARVHQLMAQSARVQNKMDEAAAEYELALRANPNLLDALLELGEIRREESNCEEAGTLYQRAQKVRSTDQGAYGLAVCLAMQGEHGRAVETFREALKHDPQSAIAHFGLGSSLLQLGETAAAVRELERAVAIEPRMRQAYYLLGRAYRTMRLLERSRLAFAQADKLAQAERAGDENALAGTGPVRRPPIRPKNP
jgi:tetratricopeptide (TPR) repeat protein